MATLDSFFPEGVTRGDGRKFVNAEWDKSYWFEPIFKDNNGVWAGIDQDGRYYISEGDNEYAWQEYKEPPKTKKVNPKYKKVKLYCAITKDHFNNYSLKEWISYKQDITDYAHKIVGHLEWEVEVTE